MAIAFTRQLGAESGVQLNPLRDSSEIPSSSNADQIFGIVMRATRGRIDKPFVVDSGTVYTKLGFGEPMRVNALNEAWVHVVEALSNGAYQAVVQRLSTSESKVKWAVIKKIGAEAVVGLAKVGESTVGESKTVQTRSGEITFEFSTTTDDTAPESCFIAVKHLECFNDGIKVRLHADEVREGGEEVASSEVTLQILDPQTEEAIYEFTGSLLPDARDDYGNSYYLPDVVSSQTDAVEVMVGVTGEEAVVEPGTAAYGYADNGTTAWAESDVLVCFTEGTTTFDTQAYTKACNKLKNTQYDFMYLSSGGTQAKPLLQQLALLAYDTNKQLRFDVPGNLTVEAAIAWVEDLNFGANKAAHLLQAFWTPLKTDDPTGVNPKSYIGTATLNIALACGRNAVKNAKGFAAKNYPIAGREWQVNRTGIVQTWETENKQKELNMLAKAKINPVIYETYTGGGRYVFFDSITCAKVEQSQRKLIAVADMSTDIDDRVTRTGKDYLQLPMDICIKRTADYLGDMFAGAQASGWLVASNDPAMGGAAYRFEVAANQARPYDAMDVRYWTRYTGTNRQIFVTQTLTR